MNREYYHRPASLVEDNPMDGDRTQDALARYQLTNPVQGVRNGERMLDVIPLWQAGQPWPLAILSDHKHDQAHYYNKARNCHGDSVRRRQPGRC